MDEFKTTVKERVGDIEREVALELWEKYSRSVKTVTDLLKLAESAPFKDYQDELPMSVGSSGSGKGKGSGKGHVAVTDKDIQGALEVFEELKATSKDDAVALNAVMTKLGIENTRWQSIKKRLPLSSNGVKGKGSRIWIPKASLDKALKELDA